MKTPPILPGGKIEGASVFIFDQRGCDPKIALVGSGRTHRRHSLFPGALAVASVKTVYSFQF
jgi:hypothetical protein